MINYACKKIGDDAIERYQVPAVYPGCQTTPVKSFQQSQFPALRLADESHFIANTV